MRAHNKGNLCARCYITFLVSNNAERKEGRKQHVGSVSIFQLLSFVIQTYKNITYHLSRFLR